MAISVLNPLYKRVSEGNYTEYSEIFSILLISALNYFQSIDLEKDVKLKGNKRSDIYTYLISWLFNSYVNNVKDEILKFDFIVPEFFNKDKFRINKEIILNKTTRTLINENPKLEYIFKCIYFSFRYPMKESIGLLEGNMLKIFNKYIEQLNIRIEGKPH